MPRAPLHQCEVLASPWPGVYAAAVHSERHYGRHSHATFGFTRQFGFTPGAWQRAAGRVQ